MNCGRCGGDIGFDKDGNTYHTFEECDVTNRAGNIGCLVFVAIVLGFLVYCLSVSN